MALRNFLKLRANEGGGGFAAGDKGVYLDVVSSAALSPAIVGAATVAEQSFAFIGARVGDIVLRVEKPTHQAGLAVVGGRIDADDAIVIAFINPTAAGITPTAAEIYKAAILRINK